VARQHDPELEKYRQLGRWLSLAELDEDTAESKGAAAALRFALAAELGVNPTAALTELSFIHGRLNLSAQLVRALADRDGYRVKRVELTPEYCTAALIDKATGEVLSEVTYTMEDARAAGLIRAGGGWTKSPQRMLWARASKRVVDDFAPAVSLGITTPEDQAEIDAVLEGEVQWQPAEGIERVENAEPELPVDPQPAPEPEAEVVDAEVVPEPPEPAPDEHLEAQVENDQGDVAADSGPVIEGGEEMV